MAEEKRCPNPWCDGNGNIYGSGPHPLGERLVGRCHDAYHQSAPAPATSQERCGGDGLIDTGQRDQDFDSGMLEPVETECLGCSDCAPSEERVRNISNNGGTDEGDDHTSADGEHRGATSGSVRREDGERDGADRSDDGSGLADHRREEPDACLAPASTSEERVEPEFNEDPDEMPQWIDLEKLDYRGGCKMGRRETAPPDPVPTEAKTERAEIQRYENVGIGSRFHGMQKNSDGKWCRYKDAADLLTDLEQRLELEKVGNAATKRMSAGFARDCNWFESELTHRTKERDQARSETASLQSEVERLREALEIELGKKPQK